jgi:hypothetical protein
MGILKYGIGILLVNYASAINLKLCSVDGEENIHDNSYYGWAQHNFINNNGEVVFTAHNFDVQGSYSFSEHIYYWNINNTNKVNLTPDMDDRYDYYPYAFNDQGNIIYEKHQKNHGADVAIYQYGLNNHGDYLYYYDYSYCALVSQGRGYRFDDFICLYLNDNKNIVGHKMDSSGKNHAVMASNIITEGQTFNYNEKVLGALPNHNSSFPTDLNNNNISVGWSMNNQDDGSWWYRCEAKAVLWKEDETIELSFPPIKLYPDSIHHPQDSQLLINDNNMVAYLANTGAFLWDDGNIINITEIITTSLNIPDWIRWGQEITLVDFSNSGLLIDYDNNLYVFEIIPEPATISLLALGAFWAGRKRK